MSATILQIGSWRTCSKCGETKTVESFFSAPRVKSGLQRECKDCVSSRSTKWWRDNQDRYNTSRRNTRYNVNFNALWEAQGGLCGICNLPMLPRGKKAKSAVVDHDRKCCPGRTCCGKCVRGLVHSRCNIVLGTLEKESATLEAAKEYLRQHEARR